MAVGTATRYTLDGLPAGQTSHFAVTAVDADGHESDYSDEVSKLVQ